MPKTLPYKLHVKRGVDALLTVRYTGAVGLDLSSYTSDFVCKSCDGTPIFGETVPMVIEAGTPHIARANHRMPKSITEKLMLGEEQAYHVLLSGPGFSDIYVHGPLNAYVASGGVE
jgi:hypothetical protein